MIFTSSNQDKTINKYDEKKKRKPDIDRITSFIAEYKIANDKKKLLNTALNQTKGNDTIPNTSLSLCTTYHVCYIYFNSCYLGAEKVCILD